MENDKCSVVMRLDKNITPPTLILTEQGDSQRKSEHIFEEDGELTSEVLKYISDADNQIVGPGNSHVQKALRAGQWVVFQGTIEQSKNTD